MRGGSRGTASSPTRLVAVDPDASPGMPPFPFRAGVTSLCAFDSFCTRSDLLRALAVVRERPFDPPPSLRKSCARPESLPRSGLRAAAVPCTAVPCRARNVLSARSQPQKLPRRFLPQLYTSADRWVHRPRFGPSHPSRSPLLTAFFSSTLTRKLRRLSRASYMVHLCSLLGHPSAVVLVLGGGDRMQRITRPW